MPRSILFIICLISLVACVSGYGLNLDCMDQVIAGTPIKCSIDSDFPAGTVFSLELLSPSQSIASQQGSILENQATQYKFFDTAGLSGGTYSIVVRLKNGAATLRTGSKTEETVIITNAQQAATTITTIIPQQTSTVTVQTTKTLTTSITTLPTQVPTAITSADPTKSVQDLLNEQNKKIDEQNKLIAEQNKKIESQNDLLTQFMSKFKSIFGWN